jgi:lipopolysaccharide export system permease protein
MFIVTIFLMAMAFLNNNYIVPKANLKAYSLLYDIKKKKPALDIKEGAFYGGLQGLSIKVNEKFDNGELKDIIIYDHRQGVGNDNIVIADSGRMYTILNEKYLVLELFDGNMYAVSEMPSQGRRRARYNEVEPFRRDNFESSKLVLSLAEFDFTRTKEDLFKSSRLMKNLKQLKHDIDSLARDLYDVEYYYYGTVERNSLQYMRDKVNVPEFLKEQKQINDSLRMLELERENEEDFEEFRDAEEQQENLNDSKINKFPRKPDSTTTTLDSLRQEKQIKKYERKPIRTRPKQSGEKANLDKPKMLFASLYTIQPVDTLSTIQDSITITQDTLLADYDSIQLDSINEMTDESLIEMDSATLAQARRDTIFAKIDSAFDEFSNQGQVLSQAVSQARFLKSTLSAESTKIRSRFENLNKHKIERQKKYAQAFACLVFFLIGAPLGAIIKRGGLGIPVIISIVFFIFYYIITMTGEKWARQGVVDTFWGVWGANLILLPIGLFFLKQARNDARLFDADFYNVAFNKIRIFLSRFFNR